MIVLLFLYNSAFRQDELLPNFFFGPKSDAHLRRIKRGLKEIRSDLDSGRPMNRLVKTDSCRINLARAGVQEGTLQQDRVLPLCKLTLLLAGSFKLYQNTFTCYGALHLITFWLV